MSGGGEEVGGYFTVAQHFITKKGYCQSYGIGNERGWTWYIGMSCVVWCMRVCVRARMLLWIGTDLLKKWTSPNIEDILIAGRTLWKHTKTIVSSSFILRILPKASAAPPGWVRASEPCQHKKPRTSRRPKPKIWAAWSSFESPRPTTKRPHWRWCGSDKRGREIFSDFDSEQIPHKEKGCKVFWRVVALSHPE